MAELTEAQRKRKEAREQRRGKPAPEQADEDGSGGEQPLDAVKNAAKVAAAGAAVGAAAAAARAFGSRHEEDGEGEPEAEERDEAEHSELQPQDEQEQEEPRAEGRVEEQAEPEQEQVREQEDDDRQEPVEGAALEDAGNAASEAKQQLQELLGRPAESVSSLERTHDGWVVVLEVVELERIPESTDVLASYELELDEELNFRRYQQARRYTRSQASRGEDS
jgi:hypothetical protein